MTFSEILKELRIERNLTQLEVAKSCHLSNQCISSLEQGTRNPTATTVSVLAEFFGVSTDFLLGREDNIVTSEDRRNGWSDTTRVAVTPIEDDMLTAFRKLGKKFGIGTQKSVISLIETMIESGGGKK